MRKSLKNIKNPSKAKEYRRKLSVRKKVIGSPSIPRICATKTNKNIYVQVIDDQAGKTLFAVQTFGKNTAVKNANVEGAKQLGLEVGKKLKESSIEQAVFDRNGKKYTGVIAALADAVREAGIQI